jgi:hypothetical protein
MASKIFFYLDASEVKEAIYAIAAVMNPRGYEFRQIMSKAVSAGGRILAESIRAQIKPPQKIKRGSDPSLNSTGLMKKSITFVLRQTRDLRWYVLVGASRESKKSIRRGRTTIERKPANYVHLMDAGFMAVARQKGTKGRGNSENLRLLRGKAVQQKLLARPGETLNRYETRLLNSYQTATSNSELMGALKLLEAQRAKAKTTWVPGQNFIKPGFEAAKSQAVQAVLDGLGEWAAKIFERRMDRYSKRIGGL